MAKWIIRDYFTACRWENIKEILKTGVWVWPIYWLILSKDDLSAGKWVVILSFYIVVLFVLFSGALHKMDLPKQLFLCPLSKQMRRAYVSKAAMFRIGLSSVIFVLTTVVFVLNGYFDVRMGVVLVGNGILLSVLMCGMSSKAQPTETGVAPLTKMRGARGTALGSILVTLWVLASSCVTEYEPNEIRLMSYILLGVMVIVELPLTVYYMSFFKQCVERAIDYENSNSAARNVSNL